MITVQIVKKVLDDVDYNHAGQEEAATSEGHKLRAAQSYYEKYTLDEQIEEEQIEVAQSAN